MAPKEFNSIELGETFVGEKREVIGKVLKTNIMNLGQGGYKRQNVEVGFVVTGLHDDKAVSEFNSYQIVPSAIKRMIRRGKNKVEDSFVVKTVDGKMLKIKPLLVTRSKTNASVQTNLRKALKQFIVAELAKMKVEDFARDLVAHRFQKMMYDVAFKVYPVSTCEVRWAHITNERKPAEKVDEKKEVKEEEEESPVLEAEEQEQEAPPEKSEKEPETEEDA